MKKFITANSTLLSFDTESSEVKKAGSAISTMIDYTFVAPEDGTITTNGKELQVKAGDVILKMYGTYDDIIGERSEGDIIIIDCTSDFGKYMLNEYYTNEKRRKERAECSDQECKQQSVG